MKLLDKLLNKKVVDLDQDGKIESIRDEIDGITAGFKRMFDNLERASNRLNDIVLEEEEKIVTAEANIDKAKEQIEKNNRIQEQLKGFI